MEAIYELRARFGEDAEDIVASEHSEFDLQLVQGNDLIIIPKAHASAFAKALTTWISTDGKAS